MVFEVAVGNGSNLTLSDFSLPNNTSCCFIYRALISQSSSNDPQVSVLGENSIGTIQWTRVNSGHYYGSTNGLFSVSKTWYYIAQTKTSVNSDSSPIFTMNVVDNNTIEILTYIGNPFDGLQDGLLNSVPIEIKTFQ